MRIASIRVENFRAIRSLEIKNLSDAVVIAGPNGCGKSSLLDAIRLLKSAYGQYHKNEYRSFFQEYKINVKKVSQESSRFLHDPTRPLDISASFEFAEAEREYLKANAAALLSQLFWDQVISSRGRESDPAFIDPATRRTHGEKIENKVNQALEEIEKCLNNTTHQANLRMRAGEEPLITKSALIELVFNSYNPDNLGIIDYHSPDRSYEREQLGGVNLKIKDPNERRGQHALYNTQSKYRNIKTQMAQSYVRQILAMEAGVELSGKEDLNETLRELFEVFFPSKKFLGPVPTKEGELSFPIELESGRQHDINELSSGEKEVLLGYLHLRNSAPENSIILLDEPELHLNPRLTRGLPRFYQKHLGENLSNQLWLITHSDTLLREAVEEPSYDVYHMQLAHTVENEDNQVYPVSAVAGVERVLIDLVGDLATYSPRSKVVILEGGGESEFDVRMVTELFPTFADRVNLISGGPKQRVQSLQSLLEKASKDGRLDARFFSIVDRDGTKTSLGDTTLHQYKWDVYHIENYLLDAQSIHNVLTNLELGSSRLNVSDVHDSLRRCAEQTVKQLIRIQMRKWVNEVIISCIDLGYDPSKNNLDGIREALDRSGEKIKDVINTDLSKQSLQKRQDGLERKLMSSLEDGSWKSTFRGKDILKRFVDRHAEGVTYERFRNLIINEMRESGYQPDGMATVLNAILAK